MCKKIVSFVRKETVLCISTAAALLSMLITPPGRAYLDYIDTNVLMLLFSLMAVVAGLRRCGLWDRLSGALLLRAKRPRSVCALLVFLCFFAAMLVTNDVALITFVPMAISLLASAGEGCVISTVVLMTIAANLGSMATPIGNPQNLFLYSAFSVPFGRFEAAILPVAGISTALLLAAVFSIRAKDGVSAPEEARRLAVQPMCMHLLLFAVCLLSVLKLLPVWAAFAAVALLCALFDRAALVQVDYSLLLTFVFFFILAGNLSGSEAVRSFIGAHMQGKELFFGAGLSQIISNVPAAVLLSSFTENWRALLLGVNIGGLGTPVASLASLISLRIYARSSGAQTGRYMAMFLGWNALFLAVLVLFSQFIL